MGKSSRAKRQRAQDRLREKQQLRDLTRDVLESFGEVGMSIDEAVALVRDAAEEMARAMRRVGGERYAPWGKPTYDYRALRKTVETAFLLLEEGEDLLERRGDAPDLSDQEAQRACRLLTSGASSLGAAAALYLASSPLPYRIARHMRARRQ